MIEKGRKYSGIEILRIVLMIVIVAHHYVCHGIMEVTKTDVAYSIWNQGAFFAKFISCMFVPIGDISVSLFFMISGYVFFEKKTVSAVKIIKTTIFYAWINVILYVFLTANRIVDLGTVVEQLKMLIRFVFMPTTGGAWWFITAYVFLLCLIPRLNMLTNKLDKKRFVRLLVLVGIFGYAIASLGAPFFDVQIAIYFYLLGSYFRKYDMHKSEKTLKLSILSGTIWIMSGTIEYLRIHCVVNGYEGTAVVLFQESVEFLNISILIPISAIVIFKLFTRLNVKTNRVIEFLAPMTLGVYLLHDSPLVREVIWNSLFHVQTKQYLSPYFPFLFVLTVGVVCLAAIGAEMVRKNLFKQGFLRVIDKMEEYFQD